ncbi:TIR domain-containing protein [Thermogemmatispora sp.]|uniref:TIR domain-containing protein n=1 Tax=Thermogemmatispora sp. TaxID=1968838 RepID=UPI002ACBE4AA|nr:TIR domain-containing protein [Thermogemmatispora sp.]
MGDSSLREDKEKLRLFVLFDLADRSYFSRLISHMSPLLSSFVRLTSPEDFKAVVPLRAERWLSSHIESADVLVLLVSPDLLASHVYEVTISRALERARQGKMVLIPILLRPTVLEGTPLADRQMLPRRGRALSQCVDEEQDLLEIVREIRAISEEHWQRRSLPQSLSAPISEGRSRGLAGSGQLRRHYRLDEVFKRAGLPTVTFVPPSNFERLKLALVEPGRGVVIEGPSGIGKTTAVQKAIRQLGKWEIGQEQQQTITLLSARMPADRERLASLPDWHQGVVIIDDFHRLEPGLRQELIDYLKLLADTQPEDRKLVIIGIPGTGQSFISSIAFDTATRFDHFKMGRASDKEILQLIKQGEQALNVTFECKDEIIRLVDGSFVLTQFLCYYLCAYYKAIQTQLSHVVIRSGLTEAIQDLMGTLEMKFGLAIRQFAAAGGPYDQTGLYLLEVLSQNREGVLWLSLLQRAEPGRAHDVERFLSQCWPQLVAAHPELTFHLFCDPSVGVLLAEDPTLIFYLRHCRFDLLAREIGKRPAPSRQQVFICYAHEDRKWLKQLRRFLAPIEQKGLFDLWDDTLISAGSRWKEKLEDAIARAGVAIVLVSAKLLASDFVMTNQLPKLLERARLAGTLIIPIIVSPCLFEESELQHFEPANDPQKPLALLPKPAQEQALTNIARRITAAVTARSE